MRYLSVFRSPEAIEWTRRFVALVGDGASELRLISEG